MLTVIDGWVTITLLDHATGITIVTPRTCATDGYRQITAPIVAGQRYTVTVTNHDDLSGEATFTLVDDLQTR